MDKVRVACIGAGSLANSAHYPSLAQLNDVELCGLCDLNSARLRSTSERFDIPAAFTDYHDMLSAVKPDVVYAILPPHQLFDVAMDVLDRGHHLFVEKPPGVTTLQAESMARLAARKRLITAVGFQRRYHPAVHGCWKEVRRRGLVHQAVACFYKNLPPREVHPYYRGAIDVLRSDAIHALDALRYYCGLADVRSVSSEVRTLDCWYPCTFNALVCFDNGAVGVLLANWRTGKRTLRFEFHAPGASAFVDADGLASVWTDNKSEPDLATTHTEWAGSSEAYIAQGFLAENRAFIDAVKSGRNPHNSLEDAVKTMRLADRVYDCATNQGAR